MVTLILLSVLPPFTSATNIDVPSQYATIQDAIDAAQKGDTIVVQPGIYTENINFRGKEILLTSTRPLDPSIVSSTAVSHDSGRPTLVMVSAGVFSATSTVTVVKPTFGPSVPSQITVGAGTSRSTSTYVPNGSYWYYNYNDILGSTNQVVDQALTVSLSSENPAVVQVPATATIAAGNGNQGLSLQAVGTGSSTITASSVHKA
jgi:pectin methylesterase-like acyl-CoA thioesterase